LASGWTLKIANDPHIQDLTGGLEKLRGLCRLSARGWVGKVEPLDFENSTCPAHSRLVGFGEASTEHKETSMNNESIDAENRADEITDWLNGLNVRVAVRICRAYTKKKLSSLKIRAMQMSKTMRKVVMQITSRSDEDNVSDSLWVSMSQVEFMIRMFCAYANFSHPSPAVTPLFRTPSHTEKKSEHNLTKENIPPRGNHVIVLINICEARVGCEPV